MDLYWSGLAQRASENTWNERRSQFSKIHEKALQDIEQEKTAKENFNRNQTNLR